MSDYIFTLARAPLARSLHDVSCANNKRFAVVVCFRSALYASGMREKLEILEFRFLKFCNFMMT